MCKHIQKKEKELPVNLKPHSLTHKNFPRHTLRERERGGEKKKLLVKPKTTSRPLHTHTDTHTTINISNIRKGKTDQSKHTLGKKGEYPHPRPTKGHSDWKQE